jgi:hypothetical protein
MHARELSSADAGRAVLDQFGIANRLQHVRRFIWRGGHLTFEVQARDERASVWYQLQATWPAPILDRSVGEAPPNTETSPKTNALRRAAEPIVEGRWSLGSRGYLLRVGIDLAIPSAIFIRAARFEAFVPYMGRPPAQVDQAVDASLTSYINGFLDAARPVPEAEAADAERLRRLGLA